MNLYERNLKSALRIGNMTILLHIPIFALMAFYFKTEISLALLLPLMVVGSQYLLDKIHSSAKFNSAFFGFSSMVISALMIHLGKGMIEWHFHIFVTLGCLCLFANPWTIVVAAITVIIHHLLFFLFLPASVFNYDASLSIVLLHAAFVLFAMLACVMISLRFKKIIELNNELGILVASIDGASKMSYKTSSSLSKLSNQNLSSITEIASISEQIKKMVSNTKDLIREAFERAKLAKESISQSSEAIMKGEEFLKALESLKDRMDSLKSFSDNQLKDVVDAVGEISEKTQVINDIVFQTKLLSFNASVEAARAQEHGKGFSVVAEEVGKLAQSSGGAANEIAAIVENSKKTLEESVNLINDQLEKFQKDVDEAFVSWQEINSQLKTSFETVQSSTRQQEKSFSDIIMAADEQNLGVSELASTIGDIEEAIGKTMQQVQRIEAISAQLDSDSDRLKYLQDQIHAIAKAQDKEKRKKTDE